MNQISFTVPKTDWLSSNGGHGNTYAVSAKIKRLREHARLHTLRALRTGDITPMQHIQFLRIDIAYPTRAKADPPNAWPTCKPLIDGMVDAGLLPDDNSAIVNETSFRRDTTKAEPGTHRVTFTFIDQHVPF